MPDHGVPASAPPANVSVMEAARQLGVSERHLRRLVLRGEVPAWAVRRIGRRVVLARAWVEGDAQPAPAASAAMRH